MQIYSNQWKCYFSVISWPILILFVLSDRAWCGLQNFYTEFWNSLIMQIYANLFKINEKCYKLLCHLILFVLSDRAWCGLQNFYTEFWNSFIMQIYSKSMKNATSLSFLGRFWFCLFYLIGLGAGFKLLHRILKFINYANLCKFIQNQWKMLTSLSFLGWFWFCLFYLIGFGAGFKTSPQNFQNH